jgi:hypothetical protein
MGLRVEKFWGDPGEKHTPDIPALHRPSATPSLVPSSFRPSVTFIIGGRFPDLFEQAFPNWDNTKLNKDVEP